MSKMVMVAVWILIGLLLIIAGVTSMMTLYITGICLILAGLLIIIVAIKKALWKKPEMMAPAK
ncbi:hypothetical protein Mboo_1599 [Methanoregula boonei 6A8]|jgi:uncharacterized membrane protein|uniref:Uncharacterized protein n=1 Tax=Methanoregula boonei (strain DSM 21154 / JCM 14090 / 6A8) TaxID=456442 RepID=A7I8Q5_METB6|nr:hypothetical protein [Methanoregula boonei]ABS56116.1 hypothetical protein Mboo_1599 [Methanoregula boonei 6A8]